jgi:hypothetical protein
MTTPPKRRRRRSSTPASSDCLRVYKTPIRWVPFDCGIDVDDCDVPLPKGHEACWEYIRAVLAVPRDGRWYEIDDCRRVRFVVRRHHAAFMRRYLYGSKMRYTKEHVSFTWRAREGLCVRWP